MNLLSINMDGQGYVRLAKGIRSRQNRSLAKLKRHTTLGDR